MNSLTYSGNDIRFADRSRRTIKLTYVGNGLTLGPGKVETLARILKEFEAEAGTAYDGYTNFETYLATLYLENDRQMQDLFTAWAGGQHWDSLETFAGAIMRRAVLKLDVINRGQHWHKVNWTEVAYHFVDYALNCIEDTDLTDGAKAMRDRLEALHNEW